MMCLNRLEILRNIVCDVPLQQLAQAPLSNPPPRPILAVSTQEEHSMRKIEQQMINAINNNKDWRSDNTEVVSQQDGISLVYLHGNKIAEVGDDYVQLFDGGWQTHTTKSRLNAILSEFGYTCGADREYVFQKQFEWFVTAFDNFNQQIIIQEFNSGMILQG